MKRERKKERKKEERKEKQERKERQIKENRAEQSNWNSAGGNLRTMDGRVMLKPFAPVN